MTFSPRNLSRHDALTRFQDDAGIDYEVEGEHPRLELAYEIAENAVAIQQQAVRLLVDFMRHEGEFELSFVLVFERPEDNASFLLRYSFIADSDPFEFGYAYFDVCFAAHAPPAERFWPFKFVVGFH